MSKSKQVRDGYLGDLPEEIQSKIMNIHKLLVSTCADVLKDPTYDHIRDKDWAKGAIEDFCVKPLDNNEVGSVRVYKQGKRNSCMIQITGHVTNHRNDIDHELLHDFFRHVHYDMKTKVRRQFDMRLTCESEHGEPFEGFDVWTNSKVAKVIWDMFEDKKTKKIKEYKENVEISDKEMMFAEMYELPEGLQEFIIDLNSNIVESMINNLKNDKYNYMIESNELLIDNMIIDSYYETSDFDEIGNLELIKYEDGTYSGNICIATECNYSDDTKFNKLSSRLYNDIFKECKNTNDSTKILFIMETGTGRSFNVDLNPEYAGKLWNWLESHDPQVFEEKKTKEEYAREKFKKKYKYDPKDSTIEVDGKRVKVDIGKSGIINVNDTYIPRQTAALITGSEQIILDPSFFKIKNQKRRDAVLNHEIGHLKMHRLQQGDSKLFNRKYIDKDIIKNLLKTTAISCGIINDEGINDFVNTYMEDDDINKLIGQKITDEKFEKLRDVSKNAALKYIENRKNVHLNITELEADRYAANKSGEKHLKRGLREISKKVTKKDAVRDSINNSIKINNKNFNNSDKYNKIDNEEYVNNVQKILNIQNSEDIKMRSKALKDPVLRNSPIYKESFEDDIIFDPYMEANNVPRNEYNVDMSEKEAKATLKTLSQNMINDMESKKDYKVSQYTANIYANIITKNLLPLWATGFRKFTITLDSYQSFHTLEFKVPKMTQDFVSRFIQGRETINGFIHRHPEINIKMSPRIFHTMKNPDDAFNFFRSAIKYYNSGLEKYSDKLMVEAMKLNHEMKHLIGTTKLSGIITCPMQLLFIFDDVEMSNKDTFKISQEDIKTVNQFIRNIYTRYAAPEKEKKQIVEDVKEMVKALKESCDSANETVSDLSYLPEAINDYYEGKYSDHISIHNEKWITEQYDMDWIGHQKNPEVKYLQEKFGVKKLKKIPSDLVAYITIETEAIRDANDKMMISSYCLSKLEIVEWYIELLEVGSKKYIVPHTKPYLETLRTQLLQCFDNIMKVKIINPNSRPIIDIKYPKGYEG